MEQITTITLFRLTGWAHKWWAFKQMQLALPQLDAVEGLEFSKLMGSGAAGGFGAFPNLSTYVLLAVWTNEAAAVDFFENNPFYRSYAKKAEECFTVFAQNAMAHGAWSGKQPFKSAVELQADAPVLVLTRARIRTKKLWAFWRRVGRVSKSLAEHPEHSFAIGVGEWPLIQQATVSLWKDAAAFKAYAYQNPQHKAVVQLTRTLNWYQEELFARFVPYRFEGQWGALRRYL